MNMSFPTIATDHFFTHVGWYPTICIADEVTFEPSCVVTVVSDDIGDW